MKKSILHVLRNSPASSGFLLLLILFRLTGVKVSPTSMQEVCFFIVYFGIMSVWLFIVPKLAPQKREKMTWIVVGSSVLLLTLAAKIFI